jgi:hypothetical protein
MALVPVVQFEFRCAAMLPPRASSDQSNTVPRAWRQIKLANPANSFANRHRQRCSSRGFTGVYALLDPGARMASELAKTIGAKALFRIPESLGGITAGDHVVAM